MSLAPKGVGVLQNNYVTNSKVIVPTMIKVFLFMFCFLLGMDFGVSKIFPKRKQRFIKCMCWVWNFILFLILLIPVNLDEVDFYWYLFTLLEFTCIFVILKLTKYTAYDFLVDLHNIDKKIVKVNNLKIGVIFWVYFFMWYFARMCIDIIYCEIFFPKHCDVGFYHYLVCFIPENIIDFMFLIPILIYCYLYYCLKDLNELLKNELNISFLRKRYVAIIESYEKIRPFYEKMIILKLLEIPKMMGLIYNMLRYMADGEDLIILLGEYIFASNVVSNIVCTGAIGQMVASQVESLKFQLHRMLLSEKDDKNSEEINRLLGYIGSRSLWRPVAGVIPVDMQLATTALGVFATYMIVLVQFTHVIE